MIPTAARPIASTTKMMTALVAAEFSTFDELVTVSASAAEAGEAEIGLVAGEIIPMGDLVSAILVRSANDAAEAIAEHVGGSVEGFADLMNQKAAEMGLTNSHFVNPHGLDTPEHYSSAADLLQIARAVLANPQLAAMVKSTSIDFPPAPDGTPAGRADDQPPARDLRRCDRREDGVHAPGVAGAGSRGRTGWPSVCWR